MVFKCALPWNAGYRGNRNTYFFAGRAIRIALPERIISSWDWSSFVTNKKAITIKTNIFEIKNFIQAPPFNQSQRRKQNSPAARQISEISFTLGEEKMNFNIFRLCPHIRANVTNLWPFSSIIVQRPPNSSLEMAQASRSKTSKVPFCPYSVNYPAILPLKLMSTRVQILF